MGVRPEMEAAAPLPGATPITPAVGGRYAWPPPQPGGRSGRPASSPAGAQSPWPHPQTRRRRAAPRCSAPAAEGSETKGKQGHGQQRGWHVLGVCGSAAALARTVGCVPPAARGSTQHPRRLQRALEVSSWAPAQGRLHKSTGYTEAEQKLKRGLQRRFMSKAQTSKRQALITPPHPHPRTCTVASTSYSSALTVACASQERSKCWFRGAPASRPEHSR